MILLYSKRLVFSLPKNLLSSLRLSISPFSKYVLLDLRRIVTHVFFLSQSSLRNFLQGTNTLLSSLLKKLECLVPGYFFLSVSDLLKAFKNNTLKTFTLRSLEFILLQYFWKTVLNSSSSNCL